MLKMSKFLCQQYTTVNKNYNIDYVFKCYKNLLSPLQLYIAILNGLWRRTSSGCTPQNQNLQMI